MAPVEWLFALVAGSRPVPGSRGTFLVACHPYRGAAVELPGGALVRRGDRVAEIHFWNGRIAGRGGRDAAALTWAFARDFRADLGALARALELGRLGPPVVAVFGASPLAAAGARFGFTVRPLPPGWRRAALTAWQRRLRRVFAPRVAAPGIDAETAELWMAAAELRRRYGGRGPERADLAASGRATSGRGRGKGDRAP